MTPEALTRKCYVVFDPVTVEFRKDNPWSWTTDFTEAKLWANPQHALSAAHYHRTRYGDDAIHKPGVITVTVTLDPATEEEVHDEHAPSVREGAA